MILILGKYKSVTVIIRTEFTENQKLALRLFVIDALREVDGENFTAFVGLIISPGPIQDFVIRILTNFMNNVLQMHGNVPLNN